ncbi:unnamed protein product [Arabidopsis lyrata]|uniref:Uncharacterized protein n=1 Tax=Arabidopsis lyrata subsp. lyrata TaxID=81972 RepID=D7KB42_ARALL|nr:defensin-like protein 199 [Arabidopsis lyrata subsp. lyrata]EFH68239.1 hypothetical protein ARALYDRAFT_892845 [Arabidopsis lyrata subsp. lyrata]CAH8256674.1 unnamed protein product [Arabidopsis lyrata]|eukprot:XP_002891980.1 defensin-like protein 199 [Arabidopsis lyrata subsp. lyrata]
MAITVRTLVAFVFTIFIIISFVHSRTTTSGYGMLFDAVACEGGFEYCPPGGGDAKCTAFCKTLPNKYDFGVCSKIYACCCHKNV